jgi:hypothetical protein
VAMHCGGAPASPASSAHRCDRKLGLLYITVNDFRQSMHIFMNISTESHDTLH